MCDATYGFSIGRGAFNFTAGDWTHVAQNVVLNTPGNNDGGFTLLVDGRPVITRSDIFYRDVAQLASKEDKSVSRAATSLDPSTTTARRMTPIMLDEDQGVPQPAEFLGLFFRYVL